MICYPTECISFFNASFIVFLMYIFRLLWICCSFFFSLKFFFFSLLFAIFLISSLEISYFFFLRLAMCALICFSNRIAVLFMFMCIVLRISFFSFSFKTLFHRIYCDFAHKPIMKNWTKSRAQIYLDSVVFCSCFSLEFRSSAMGDLSSLSWFC